MSVLSEKLFLEKFAQFSRATVITFPENPRFGQLSTENKFLVFPLLGISVIDQHDGVILQRPDFKIELPITEIETVSEQEQGLRVIYKLAIGKDGKKYFNSELMIKRDQLKLTVQELNAVLSGPPIFQQEEFEELKSMFLKRLGIRNLDLNVVISGRDAGDVVFVSRVQVKDGYYSRISKEESSAISTIYTWVEVCDKKLVFVSKPSCNLTPEEKLKLQREKLT